MRLNNFFRKRLLRFDVDCYINKDAIEVLCVREIEEGIWKVVAVLKAHTIASAEGFKTKEEAITVLKELI